MNRPDGTRRPLPLTSPAWVDIALLAMAMGGFVWTAMLLGRAVAASANSDCLYLSAMYRDLFVDRVSLRAWHTQPAPSFFPDFVLFALTRALSGSSAAALWAYAVVELSFGVFAIADVAALLEVPNPRRRWSIALLSMSVLAYVGSFGEFFHLAFSPSCHASCVWVSVGSALLLGRQIKAKRWSPRASLAVLLLTALTAASDQLYLVHAAGLAVALVLSFVLARELRAPALANVLGIGLGAALVPWLTALPRRFGIEVEPHPPSIEFSWKRILYVLDRLPPPDREPFAVALYATFLVLSLALAGSVCVLAAAHHSVGKRRIRGALTFFASAFVASIACVFFGNAFSGSYWNEWSARYMHALYLFPYLVLPIAWLLGRRGPVRLAILSALLAVPAMSGWPKVVPTMQPLLADSALYPASVACVDDIARRYGVRGGYGEYWYARRFAELSRTGLHLVALDPSMRPGDGICNRSWYAKIASSSPFLILTGRLDATALRARFGPPSHVESCQGCCNLAGPGGGCGREDVWVYEGTPRARIVP